MPTPIELRNERPEPVLVDVGKGLTPLLYDLRRQPYYCHVLFTESTLKENGQEYAYKTSRQVVAR
jgi:hypothetical protein|tara:strand:+ start:2254 stop:2448 length:195 start_codon:yes stop_codon:yes gene_type:complete